MGYYTNILARRGITKVQIRQIVKELVRMDFDDVYSSTKSEFKFKRGFEKAVEMLEKEEGGGVFTWALQLKYWLKDPDYVFWLGTVRRR